MPTDRRSASEKMRPLRVVVDLLLPAVHRDRELVVRHRRALHDGHRNRRRDDYRERLVLFGGLHARVCCNAAAVAIGAFGITCEVSTSLRPATPPVALISSTAACAAFTGSPRSGARCCFESRRGRRRRSRRRTASLVMPTVEPAPRDLAVRSFLAARRARTRRRQRAADNAPHRERTVASDSPHIGAGKWVPGNGCRAKR